MVAFTLFRLCNVNCTSRPELVRPVQGATSVIRISPNPRQWSHSVAEQQSVILQNALTTPASHPPPEPEAPPSQMQTSTLYCVLQQNQDMENEKCKENPPFQRQIIQSDHLQPTIRVTTNNNNTNSINNTNPNGTGLHVIVHPTQLVPVLPAAPQSVVKRVVPAPAPVPTITQQLAPHVIVKSEQTSNLLNHKESSHISQTSQVQIQPPVITSQPLSSPVQTLQPRSQITSQKIPQPAQSAFVIPWHSIVPIFTAATGPASPPLSELSPPLSAPPVPNSAGTTTETGDEEADTEPMPVTTEDDDDVFETDNSEALCGGDSSNNNNNKRRSQSLSSLQNAAKESGLTKVCLIV